MIYNDEEWRIIKEASPHYKTARQEYIRNAPLRLTEQILITYENATGKTILNKDLSCANCVLNIYKEIGKTYFSDLEEREKLEEEKKNVVRDEKPKRRNQKKTKGDS